LKSSIGCHIDPAIDHGPKTVEFTEFTSGPFPAPELPKRMTATSLSTTGPLPDRSARTPPSTLLFPRFTCQRAAFQGMPAFAETKAAPRGNKPSRPGTVPGETARS
jgi:hypothetical protein